MMSLMPVGIKGLVFAALVAAIVSSLASMTNSISTIFTMDIYKKLHADKSQSHYVNVGRVMALLALIVALLVAKPLLGQFEQAFQYIQEFTGFFTPGIVVIFVLGMFYKGTTANGALAAAFGSALFSLSLKFAMPSLPFMDRVGLVFVLCLLLCFVVSKLFKAHERDSQGTSECVQLSDVSFATNMGFNVAALGVVVILIALYATWW